MSFLWAGSWRTLCAATATCSAGNLPDITRECGAHCAPLQGGRKDHASLCFQRRKNRHKRHGVGIVLPLPCRFAVIGFGVRRFAGDRVDGPGPAAGGVQLPLFLLRELFIGNEFFHSASFRRWRLAVCSGFIISQVSRGYPYTSPSEGGPKFPCFFRAFDALKADKFRSVFAGGIGTAPLHNRG